MNQQHSTVEGLSLSKKYPALATWQRLFNSWRTSKIKDQNALMYLAFSSTESKKNIIPWERSKAQDWFSSFSGFCFHPVTIPLDPLPQSQHSSVDTLIRNPTVEWYHQPLKSPKVAGKSAWISSTCIRKCGLETSSALSLLPIQSLPVQTPCNELSLTGSVEGLAWFEEGLGLGRYKLSSCLLTCWA